MASNQIPNLRFTESWQDTTIHYINISVNILSIVSATVVLLILLAMRIYDRRLVDRVTLRLTAAVSLTDLISSITLVVYSVGITKGIGCQMIAFLIIWLTNQYLFLTTAIAFNLKWLFLQKRYFNPAFEKWYYILSILLSLLTGALPLSAQMLGYDDAQGLCWFTPSYTWKSQVWEYTTYIFPQIVCSVYCAIVVGFVVFRLKRDVGQFEKSTPQEMINSVVRRIMMYPLTPILTQTGFIVSEIYMYQTLTISYELNVWGVLTKALPGFFNLMAFLIDPAFISALKKLKQDMIHHYGDPERQDPMTPSPSVRSLSERSYKIYADHGALDFVLPQNRHSMVALATRENTRTNRCMRWLVLRLWPASASSTRREEDEQQNPSEIQEQESHPNRYKPMLFFSSGASSSSSHLTVPGLPNNNKNSSSSPAYGRPMEESHSKVEEEQGSAEASESNLFQPLPAILPDSPTEPISPPPALTIPICFEELDEVVPWRVLEADEDEEDDFLSRSTLAGNKGAGGRRRRSSRKRGSHISERVDSWLELNEPPSPSRVSQWFNKRSGSFESVREQLARSSKSLRRWRRQQQQQQQQQEDLERPSMEDQPYQPQDQQQQQQQQRKSRIVSGFFDPTLQAVPECIQEDDELAQRANRLLEALGNQQNTKI